jgi:Zn-dependent protease
MRWSFLIGRVAGTAIRIHVTFLLFLLIIGIVVFRQSGSNAALDAVAFITLVFACIVLHEFGHILMARYFGIKTRDVTLFPIGGVANIERMPDKPYQELLVALAGPFVNFVIFSIIFITLGRELDATQIENIGDPASSLAVRVASANLVLMIFNLLPAFPMDGGRVFRALLAMRIGKSKATRIAAAIGQALAIFLGFMGFFGNPMLILIAIFIFIAAGSEAETATFHDATHDLTVRDAMILSPAPLRPQDTLREAINHLLSRADDDFAVVEKGNPEIGTVTRDKLLLALAAHDDGTPVSSVMRKAEHILHENEPLENALSIFERSDAQALIVKDKNDEISGLISRAAIAQAILIKTARPNWVFHRGGILSNSLPTINHDQQVASLLP